MLKRQEVVKILIIAIYISWNFDSMTSDSFVSVPNEEELSSKLHVRGIDASSEGPHRLDTSPPTVERCRRWRQSVIAAAMAISPIPASIAALLLAWSEKKSLPPSNRRKHWGLRGTVPMHSTYCIEYSWVQHWSQRRNCIHWLLSLDKILPLRKRWGR